MAIVWALAVTARIVLQLPADAIVPVGIVQPEEQRLDDLLLVAREELAAHVEGLGIRDVPVVGNVRPQQPAIVLMVPGKADLRSLGRRQRIVQRLDEVFRLRSLCRCRQRQRTCPGCGRPHCRCIPGRPDEVPAGHDRASGGVTVGADGKLCHGKTLSRGEVTCRHHWHPTVGSMRRTPSKWQFQTQTLLHQMWNQKNWWCDLLTIAISSTRFWHLFGCSPMSAHITHGDLRERSPSPLRDTPQYPYCPQDRDSAPLTWMLSSARLPHIIQRLRQLSNVIFRMARTQ